MNPGDIIGYVMLGALVGSVSLVLFVGAFWIIGAMVMAGTDTRAWEVRNWLDARRLQRRLTKAQAAVEVLRVQEAEAQRLGDFSAPASVKWTEQLRAAEAELENAQAAKRTFRPRTGPSKSY